MVQTHEPVAAARQVAEEVLAPAAEATDQAQLLPRRNLEALARAGLFGLAEPGAAPASTLRQVHELLAGACGATSFVWAQHHSPLRMLAASGNQALRERWLGRLRRGEALAGVAFAYLRRSGAPAVAAEPVGETGRWRVRGSAPFVTSWGLAEVFLVVAVTPGDQLVWFLVGGRATDGVRPAPLRLSVLQATGTVQLHFEDLRVAPGDVVTVEPLAAWRERDRVATVQPSAAALGVAGRCCRLLAERADETGQAPVRATAEALATELDSCRARAYGLADQLLTRPPPCDRERHLAEMVQARAWGLDLAQRASLALVTAGGGRAVLTSRPAQRLAREAAFYAVQAQTAAVREASLARYTRAFP